MTPLLTKLSIGIGGTLVTIAVYFSSITGGNYQGAILNHLVDKIQGNTTYTSVSLNAPNWRLGIPLATPISTTVATTTGGSMASSTKVYFSVAAIDNDGGTTTVSSIVNGTTDASTTGQAAENLVVSWSPVTAAQGYAVYFSTTSATILSNYFTAAASTSSYTLSTTTGSKSGTNALIDTTAYAAKISPTGLSYFNGGGATFLGGSVGFGTSTPASSTPVDIGGFGRALTATTTACEADTRGVFFYNPAHDLLWLCKVAGWAVVK